MAQFYPQFFKYTYPHNAAFPLIYPPKADFFAGFSIPFASFINCFMQNEPNFTPNAPTKHEKDANFTTKKYLFLINSSTLFLIFFSKVRVFRHVLQLSNISTLNSIHNKDLHKYFTPPKPPIFNHRATSDERPATNKYAKRTQLQYSK